DPIRAKDYYQLFAFFNNIDGPAMDGNSAKWEPIAAVPTPAQREAMRSLDVQIASIKGSIAAGIRETVATNEARVKAEDPEDRATYIGRADFVWVDDALPAGAAPQGDVPWDFLGKPDHPVYSGRGSLGSKGRRLRQFVFENAGAKLVVG